ncbi:alpha/beta fold hydrolase [Brachybacterium sp. EF45031]|uniref:alpha/beta hydrolase n=1 Tax=Brachybacterium sillae TaxID=2810536 RepID=UPI00217D0FCA|nr:alpha/beta fold hydrolase [Brachybacterium sillae]MCS6710491.1 alpha/beta fold hydrolase [Brachybacterium sillae]
MTFSELSRPWRGAAHPSPRGAVVLLHGFTASPQSVRPWAEALDARGWDVTVPLLPGHATDERDMARTAWTAWFETAREAVSTAAQRHGTVGLGGLSMGGALALACAADADLAPRIGALALVNPAVALMHRWQDALAPALALLPVSLPAIAGDIGRPGLREEAYARTPLRAVGQLHRLQRHTLAHLGEVTAPLLLATSTVDHVVPVRSSDLIASRVRGPVERLPLTRSYHVATLDEDADLIAQATDRHLARYLEVSGDTGSDGGSR